MTLAIGAGGMGEVLNVRDTLLNRDVASLNHPNIKAIYGIEETPSTTPRDEPFPRKAVTPASGQAVG